MLRDKFGTADFTQWGKYSKFDESLVDELCKDNADEINLTYYIQYNLDKQLKDSCDYAHKHGVVLKGDIPIGISRASADAWVDPDLFNLNSQAGAPPDDFSVLGQNWGLPTYNWERMSQDGFNGGKQDAQDVGIFRPVSNRPYPWLLPNLANPHVGSAWPVGCVQPGVTIYTR